MTRLIDADALKAQIQREIDRYFDEYGGGIHTAMEARDEIDYAPTVDAVPVIRCKDCKYWDDHWAGLNVTKCKAFDWRSKPDDFCSFAERKEA